MVHPTSNRLWFSPLMTLQIVVLLTFCDAKATRADEDNREKKFCFFEVRVNLTTASTNASDFLAEIGYFFPWATDTLKAGSWRGRICDLKPSLPICPPLGETNTGEIYANSTAIPGVYTTNLTTVDGEAEQLEERFHLYVGNRCSGKLEYFLKPDVFEDEDFHLSGNGSLLLPRAYPEVRSLGYESYCLLLQPNASSSTPMICFPKHDWIDLCDLLAVPFLIATVIVYSILPEFKNMHGTTLRCYLYCIIVTHVTLATHRMIRPYYSDSASCLCLVFTIYFSLYGSLMWLNVICIDMWWRFGGFGSLRSSGVRHTDRKRFFWYSSYAWGVTVVMTSICIGMEFWPGIPESVIRPGFRSGACWFNTNTAKIVYLIAPVGVTIACNACLFASTSIIIFRHKWNIRHDLERGDGRRYDHNEQWFGLYAKLFVMMGLCWSTNIVFSLTIPEEYLWYFTTAVAQLQGLLIFGIFVCKKNVWRSLKHRCSNKKLRKIASQFYYLSYILRSSTDKRATAAVDEKMKDPRLDSSVYSISSLVT